MIFKFIRHTLGIDRAIGASALTQLVRFATGPITMMLIVKYLTPAEQGYFYAFAGVLGISVFLEAGFAQSITQFASREFANLRFTRNGILTGSPKSLSRLRSIFHKANRYYTVMASVLTIILGGGGYIFFSLKPDDGISWQIPWLIVSISAGFQFLLTPFWAILEGCNRVAAIATFRLWTTLIGFALTASSLLLHMGVYVTAVTSLVVVFSFAYLLFCWKPFLLQILRPVGLSSISWGNEIWSFQWRIASTWMAGYLLTSAMPALAFQIGGAIVAGQLGMTLTLTRMGATVASAWSVTKLPFLGSLHAKGARKEFEHIWRKAAFLHIIVSGSFQIALILAIAILRHFFPILDSRILNQPLLIIFSIGFFSASFLLIFSHYTRACRSEPFVYVTTGMAISFLVLSYIGGPFMGISILPISFAAVHSIAALLAYIIWQSYRDKLWNIC